MFEVQVGHCTWPPATVPIRHVQSQYMGTTYWFIVLISCLSSSHSYYSKTQLCNVLFIIQPVVHHRQLCKPVATATGLQLVQWLYAYATIIIGKRTGQRSLQVHVRVQTDGHQPVYSPATDVRPTLFKTYAICCFLQQYDVAMNSGVIESCCW